MKALLWKILYILIIQNFIQKIKSFTRKKFWFFMFFQFFPFIGIKIRHFNDKILQIVTHLPLLCVNKG